MPTTNRWKEALLSLAAGQSMVPFADNGAAIRRLSRRVWALRAMEAAKGATRPQPSAGASTCRHCGMA